MFTAIIVGAIAIFLALFVIVSYKKCPPDMAYIISGLGREPRVLIGKAGFVIPFFERVDKLTLELIQIDVRASEVPTTDFINVDVDAVANVRIPKDPELIKIAAQHFLNLSANEIAPNIQQVLQGNMREIIGQMGLKEIVIDKQKFSVKIQENAVDDIKKIGLEIVSFNVQDCTDKNDAIKNLGTDNLSQIQKEAAIAKAKAEKEVIIEQAKADEEGAKARAEADARIAEQQKDLSIKRSEFKKIQDTESARADAAKGIEDAAQQKTINAKTIEAEVEKAERMAELKEREIAIKEKELDALVRKQADADKYKAEKEAEAQKAVREQNAAAALVEAQREADARKARAEAEKEAALLEAEGIKAKLLAEAEGKKAILLAEAEGAKQKALAEAEGIDKKAEAMKKMGEAAVLEMAFNALPAIAKEVASPLAQIDNITMYGDQTSDFLGSSTQNIDKVVNIAKDSLGVDLRSLVAGFIGGKVADSNNCNHDEPSKKPRLVESKKDEE